MTLGSPLQAAVFASGGGSNFQALADDAAEGRSWAPALLITDREDAGALDRARKLGIDARVVPTRGRDIASVSGDLLEALREARTDLILLAGYLKLVPAPVVEAFSGRILNIHPALLPAFGGQGMYGRHVHEAVAESGARLSGPTVHMVDEEYDRGRILAQWPVPVQPGDSPATIAARVLAAEHHLYPLVVEHVAAALVAGREVGPLAFEGDVFVSADPGDVARELTSR